MLKESGEQRVFLPELIQYLTGFGVTVFVEEGYGARSGLSFDDYKQANPCVRMCSHQEAYQQDIVLVLRSPLADEFTLMRKGGCLISMLHFPTRPSRVARLKELGIEAISLDSITNDQNLRMVENMKAVAWNGIEVSFDELERRWPGLRMLDGEPVLVLILGAGMVGKHAVEAATKLGNVERANKYLQLDWPGVVALTVGRNVTGNPVTLERLFRQADVLVDASQRRDTSTPIIPNHWLDWLPEHAIVADLAVDPYTLETTPPVVRGIEGIPQGNLDKFVFSPDDSEWGETIPKNISSGFRRTVVSCYSWPGLHPEACMRHYARQLRPLLKVLLTRGYDLLSLQGDYFERAMYRGTLRYWMKTGRYEARPR